MLPGHNGASPGAGKGDLLPKLLYSSSRIAIAAYARLMLKLDILWQAPAPAGPKLVVVNHPSISDPFYLSMLFPYPLKMLIIDNAFTFPLFGAYLRLSGHIMVVPGNGRGAFERARRLLEAGHSVAIFPEGWVSPQRGGFHPPHTGAARLAMLTGVPVIPIGIHLQRERNLVISLPINGKRATGYWYLRGPYGVTVGQPLHFEGDVDDRERVASVSARIVQRIISLAGESERRLRRRQ